MKKLRYVLISIFFFNVLISNTQEHPPIQIFEPSEYGAENQNWSISQASNKNIYIANNKGLLEFNGSKWTVYPSPNKTIFRSVKVIDQLIYTGSYRDFGYWFRNELGVLIYTSLSKKLNITFSEDEEIWNILEVDDLILFQSLNRIYIYNKKKESYAVIKSETIIYKMFKVKDNVYFQKVNNGVYEIVNSKPVLVSNNDIFRKHLLVNIFYNDNGLLFQTEDHGFYTLKNEIINKWNVTSSDKLLKVRVYNSKRLKDNRFLLGTVSNGVLLLSEDGDILQKLDQNNGLSNNTVLSVFEDIENNIWLGLETGINCINIKSPFSVYNDNKGTIGSVNTSVLFNGYLYLGTNQGLFYKLFGTNQGFSLVEGTQGAVWCLKKIDNTLFCGHNSGTFIINKNKANQVANIQGTWNIISVENNNNLLLQGNYTGLYILNKIEGSWKLRNKIEGFDMSSRYLEMNSKTKVLVNHEYKGVFKLDLNKELTKVVNVTKELSVSKGLKTSLVKYQDNILYTNAQGVYKYNTTSNQFVKDSIYSKLVNEKEFISGKLVVDYDTNRLWSFSRHGLNYLLPRKLSGIPKINKISLPRNSRNDVSGYENITHIENNTYLYGTTKGYIIVNLDKIIQKPFEVKLSLITNSKFKNRDTINLINKLEKGIFKNEENNIKFNFNVPEYDKYIIPEYQYQLVGINDEWSHWSSTSTELFENLPYGDYTFKVKARLGNTESKNTEVYSFNIKRPWYLSYLAIAVYIFIVLLFSLLMHIIYKRFYRKQRERLLLKKQRQLEIKELEYKEQNTRFNNDKLRQDIESKNRELGISTMSLIKKNEFLNSIKKELLKAQDSKGVKQVVKIIDRNLNNTDDWNLFQEAFNNADKDFLKKIKSIHPELTSNDLRLCAYLRLNLSSKEIAPLLNISSRSVEVKRYRLRKKMSLEHESSLTDYILEI